MEVFEENALAGPVPYLIKKVNMGQVRKYQPHHPWYNIVHMDYWKKQTNQPIFSGIDTEKPEQKQHTGHLLIIGGHSGTFFTPVSTAQKAIEQGIGKVHTIFPDALKSKIPSSPQTIFVPSAQSGGLGRQSLPHLRAAADQADYVLIIGDLGKNAETAATIIEFLKNVTKPTLITRDAVDLITTDTSAWITHPHLVTLTTLPQLQKLFRAAYYPKVITLSMPLNQLIETLHKFTLSYPAAVLTYHQNQIILVHQGQVVTTDLSHTPYTPITIWSGDLAVRIAQLSIWNPSRDPLATMSVAIIK